MTTEGCGTSFAASLASEKGTMGSRFKPASRERWSAEQHSVGKVSMRISGWLNRPTGLNRISNQLNAEDGGRRKWICVQLPERCKAESEATKAGFVTIADIAKERRPYSFTT